MCAPKAPKTPDPIKVANAQADANIKTAQATAALNRYDQQTPFGSVLWSQDPNNPNKYTSTTTYDPVTQALIDKTKAGVNGLVDNAGNILSNPMPKAPGMQDALNFVNMAIDNTTNSKILSDADQNMALNGNQLLLNQGQKANQVFGTDFNFNNAPAMPVADENTRLSVADALYNQAKSRLDPTYDQAQSNLESKLAAQGITLGSDAYDRATGNLMRDKNDAYTSASNTANMSGIDAMDRLFGMGMSARQQGVGEAQAIRDQVSKELAAASEANTGVHNNAVNTANTTLNRVSTIPSAANAAMGAMTQGFQNELAPRNQALAELGGGLNIRNAALPPNMNPGIAGDTQVGQTPVADATYNSFQGDLNKYAGDVGSRNNLISGLGTLGGMAMLAPAGTFTGLASGGSAALAGLMAL